MTDSEIARIRLDALNLAYGILQQKFLSSQPTLTNHAPNTDQVLVEARKLVEFIEKP